MDRDEQTRLMREQRAQGWSYERLAAEHGVSTATVSRRLNDKPTSSKYRRPRDPGVHLSNEVETAEMWRLSILGHTQAEIGERFGITGSSVSERLRRYRDNLPETIREDVLRREVELLEEMRRPLVKLVAGDPPPAYSNGRAMVDTEGNPVPDWSVIISAVTGVLRTQDRLAKFLGLDAPAKAEVLHVEQATEAAKAEADAALAFLEGQAPAP